MRSILVVHKLYKLKSWLNEIRNEWFGETWICTSKNENVIGMEMELGSKKHIRRILN